MLRIVLVRRGYRLPDHPLFGGNIAMPKYDGQIVLGFKGKEAGDEVALWVRLLGTKVIASGCPERENYHVFHAGSASEFDFFNEIATVMKSMERYFKGLNCLRIYLVGHGGFEGKTLGGRSPSFIVKHVFSNTFLKGAKNIGVINLMSCELAKTPTKQYSFVRYSDKSFASTFHLLLSEQAGIRTQVHAYPTEVKVGVGGKKYQHDPETGENRRAYQKVVYFWEDGKSKFRVDNYTPDQRSV